VPTNKTVHAAIAARAVAALSFEREAARSLA